ncbi:MAG TPA: hypothetical protein VFW13_05655 [Phenylobacterium sp.]|nr:hypothetical protein [Phenylobacterium sp.]
MISPSIVDDLVSRLQRAGLEIVQHEPGAGLTNEDRESVRRLGLQPPPPPLVKFYEQVNGITLLWRGKLDGEAVQGSLNILSFLLSAYRAPMLEDGEPLEGVLWTDDDDGAKRERLKAMAVFEPVAGRSEFITYIAGATEAQLFLVDGDDIAPLVPDFDTTVALLFRYAGAEGLRKTLTRKDWEAQIAADKTLTRVGAL